MRRTAAGAFDIFPVVIHPGIHLFEVAWVEGILENDVPVEVKHVVNEILVIAISGYDRVFHKDSLRSWRYVLPAVGRNVWLL